MALRVFAERGFDGTSMSELAEAAGVTKPVLYQHFRSKRALYLELLDDVGRRLQDTIVQATTSADTAHRQVQAGFAAYFRFVSDNPNAFRLLLGGTSRRDREFSEAVERVEDAMAAAIAALITTDLDDDHRRLLAHGLVGMAEGASRRYLAPGQGSSPESLGLRLADLAWAGLRGVKRDDQ